MERISLTCENCNHVWDLRKTNELPTHVFFMRCNWCPKCEDEAKDYYEEWWDENENNIDSPKISVGDNQLCMPFIMEEIGVPNFQEQDQSKNKNLLMIHDVNLNTKN